ncbi:MAG TPA: DUF6797 domain-containing protein [Gemmataceae bacterium]
MRCRRLLFWPLPAALFSLCATLAALGGPPPEQPDPLKKLSKEQLEELFRDVKLPEGDPIPDFRERPWVPPATDPSAMNPRGTDFGPCLAFTVQLGPKEFVRRGLTVRLPDNRAALYDLDLMRVVATWSGGFLDLSKTHFEDSKGQLPGRPGGEPVRWVDGAPGWADAQGSFADPREDKTASLPAAQVSYHGHFLHGFRVVLSYDVLGRAVLEMPGVEEKAPAGTLSRTFHVAAGRRPLKLAVLRIPEKQGKLKPIGSPSGKVVRVEMPDGSARAAAVVGAPQGAALRADERGVSLHLPASEKPVNLRLVLFAGDREGADALAGSAASLPPPADLRNHLRGGPPRWKQTLTTRGERGRDEGPYAVDTLPLPDDNPWKSWLRPGGLDFFSDGRLALASLNGDVWLVSGIDESLKELTWRRFATGLYEPLGVKIVDDRLYVLGRDRITRLHDLNLDGEADYYETFFGGGSVAPGYHAFCFDLQTDSKGNWYFLRSGRKVDDTPGYNSLVRVSPDGRRAEIVATGFRHPNGMGVGPNDEIVVGDNQGEFIPASKVSLIRPGGFYGYHPVAPKELPPYERPLFWLPMDQDNSSGGQMWAGPDWGPLSGMFLHTSFGSCKLFYVLTQFDGDSPVHAAAVPLDELKFDSGIMRGRVNPTDGQLYLAGLNGWGSKAKRDGCLHRVRHTGKPARMVRGMTLVPGGVRLEFTCALDPASAGDPKNYQLEQWNYIYSPKYGSPEVSVSDPTKKGHDPLPVKRATPGDGGKSVLLEVPGLRPVDQLRIALSPKAADGGAVRQELYATVHRVPGSEQSAGR